MKLFAGQRRTGFSRNCSTSFRLDSGERPILLNVGNQLGTIASPRDPLLGPLADNGGSTLTHALLALVQPLMLVVLHWQWTKTETH